MSDWPEHESPIPHEFEALEKALDAMFEHLEDSKDFVENENLWPYLLTPRFNQLEDDTLLAEGAARRARLVSARVYTLARSFRVQRDAALEKLYTSTPLLQPLTKDDALMITWLINALSRPGDAQTQLRLRRVMTHLAKLKEQIESGLPPS